MPSAVVRRSIWATVVVAVLVAMVLAATPYVASTRIVRDRIAAELSAWSGYRVDIGAPPVIDIWPRLGAVLTDVSFSDPQTGSDRPVGKVERMEIELAPLAAMRGDAVFTSARLVRPTFVLDPRAGGGLVPAIAGKGRFRAAIDRARAVVAENPRSPTRAALPSDPFGRVRINDGRLLVAGDGQDVPVVTGIEGSVDWPALDDPGSLSLRGVWRGEPVRLDLRSASPLVLLAGGMAPLDVAVDAAPGSASFDGTAKLDGAPFLDGQLSLTSGSLDRFANWVGIDLPGWERLQTLAVSATIASDDRRMKLDQADLQLNGDKASGALDLVFAAGRPSVSGSLAFDRLNLDELFEALLPLTAGSQAGGKSAVTLDLRLSAGQAILAGLEVTDTAVAVKIQDRFAAFDILDATAFEGELRAGFRVTQKGDGIVTDLKMAASGINGAAFGAAVGMKSLAPPGRGSVSLVLNGKGADVHSIFQAGSGHLTARFGAGVLSRFDLDTFLDLCRRGGFFPLDQAAGGSLEVDGVDVEARIVDGVAEVERAEARFGARRLWVSGLASYSDRGLALTGGVGALPGDNSPATNEAEFFVGGSWSAPFISTTAPGQTAN